MPREEKAPSCESFAGRVLPYLKASLIGDNRQIVTLPYADQPIVRSLGNNLVVTYLVDKGTEFQYLRNQDILDSNVTEASLYESSMQNLRSLMQEKVQVQAYGPVFVVFLDGNVESSLLLLDEFWDGTVAHLVRGDFVAAIPARDVLAFCDSDSANGIAELHAIVSRAQKADHKITPFLYRRKGKTWICRAE